MAPRTRSNRVEMLAREKLLASGQTFNTSGFAALPDELYFEIISHFPAYPIPCWHRHEPVGIEAIRDRHLTLLALSQTCRSLRPAFLRYLWQRIEVYDGMETGKGLLEPRYMCTRTPARIKIKMYAEELVRQLEVVTVREPNLARHVNFINVLVTEYSVDTVLAELARCIALFPNLHTVQIKCWFDRRKPLDTFTTYQYPSIKNVYLCSMSIMFLGACPEARVVSTAKLHERLSWPLSIFENALHQYPALEVLGPFKFAEGDTKIIARNWPKLREIFLYAGGPFGSSVERLSDLSKLRHLRIIYIIIEFFTSSDDLAEWLQWAKGILSQSTQNSEDNQGHRKIVLDFDGRLVTHLVEVNVHESQ